MPMCFILFSGLICRIFIVFYEFICALLNSFFIVILPNFACHFAYRYK